ISPTSSTMPSDGRPSRQSAAGSTRDALTAAQRETREELGIVAARWTPLGMVDPFTATVVSPTWLFVARGLMFVSTGQEGTERIACVKMPLADAVQMVLDSRITHGPSCVLILKAHLTV